MGPQELNGQHRTLERFAHDNGDLRALELLIHKFNIFDALDITRAEIRHSNFLAFILDPAETHEHGALFLKPILMDLLRDAAQGFPVSAPDIENNDLRDVEVRREDNRIDLTIICKTPPLVVAIENKIDSRDHSGQLNRYSERIRKDNPNFQRLFVYLTPEGSDPSEKTIEMWQPYSYQNVYGVLKQTRDAHRNTIGTDVLVFLDHYIHLLGTRFMNDTDIERLCRDIYKNHRQALKVIWERVGNPGKRIMADLDECIREDSRWSVVHQNSMVVNVVPAAWFKWLTPLAAR